LDPVMAEQHDAGQSSSSERAAKAKQRDEEVASALAAGEQPSPEALDSARERAEESLYRAAAEQGEELTELRGDDGALDDQ
jgi:hypothetical protein